jgi:hypothetical protein
MNATQVNQVAAFGKLVGICNAHGALYNPSKASIKAAALNTLLTQAQQSLQAATSARISLENAIVARNQAIDVLPKLATRIVAALKSSGVSAETLAYSKRVKRKLDGSANRKAEPPDTAPAETENSTKPVSMTQSSFESKVNYFAELVTRLATEPLYKPNETDLQLAGLNTLVTALRDRNKAVANAEIMLSAARISRNKVLFQQAGVHGAAMEIKDYIKSVFGARSDQYRQLRELKFIRRG